jgi:peptide/nickel transport system permease protein
MPFKPVFLWTDIALWLMALALLIYGWRIYRHAPLRLQWSAVWRDPAALCASMVLAVMVILTLIDSVHFRRELTQESSATPSIQHFYDTRTESLLDVILQKPLAMNETTYSAPLATHGFVKEAVAPPPGAANRPIQNTPAKREHPRLKFGGAHLQNPESQWLGDVLARGLAGAALGFMAVLLMGGMGLAWSLQHSHGGMRSALGDVLADRTIYPVRAAWFTLMVMALVAGAVVGLMNHYHVLGTDRTGNDVLVQCLKSVRTAFVMGSLATLATLPFAIIFGIVAGYFRGWVDDLIQYIYTTLSSVPNVLLIAACVLMIQVFLDENPTLFETAVERSDLKLFLLCVILGTTGWASLCRLVRAETLKLRELDFVQAATAFGVGHIRIMWRHIAPNVMHLVLITTALSFSELILYEAVLTYVGVGVDSSTQSFGTMINLARIEMSRDPVVWWSFLSAFLLMLVLVLSANLFADGVQQALDPRARRFKVRKLRT